VLFPLHLCIHGYLCILFHSCINSDHRVLETSFLDLSLSPLPAHFFSASNSTSCAVMWSFNTSCVYASIPFFVCISSIIIFPCCCNGSNWAYLSCFCPCTAFSSSCSFFISYALFILSRMAITFFLCFKSCTYVVTFSCLWSICCILSYSSRLVQMCTILSYNSATYFTSSTMLSMCAVASYSLNSLTYGGVFGVSFSINSAIS